MIKTDQNRPLCRSGTSRGAAPRAIAALMLREVQTAFGRSPGGYLWALAEPVAAIALLSIVFSVALRAPALGTSFALFYASGYLPFAAFLDIANKLANALRFSRPLLLYPAVTVADAILARLALNLLTHALVTATVIAGIVAVTGAPMPEDPLRIASALGMAATLAFGAGTINCYLFSAFPAWERIWQIVTRPLFIVSGIFFLPEDVPVPYRDVVLLNPLVHVAGEMRRGIYASYDGRHVSPLFVYGVSLALLVPGLALLHRRGSRILEQG